jgi:legumain
MSIIFLFATTLPVLTQAAKFAVIAAGSKGFFNYRHQADACHAFQVMKNTGIPEENIILMMQDDVASSSENPFPGQLFNKPGVNVVDVYAGCKVDYRGDIVTAKLFTSVITGDMSGVPANGKVLKSGPDDHVFIFFVDHGGVGIVAFPNGPALTVKDLSSTITTMQSKTMFKELVFYMEACESGSMFPDLTSSGKVLAVTAANGKESSWGTYCGSEAKVNGKAIGSCLGDLFSVSWMEDADRGQLSSETLAEQIDRVTKRTNESHVETFGDKSFINEPIGNFENKLQNPLEDKGGRNSIDARDIDVHQAYEAWAAARSSHDKAAAWKTFMAVTAARAADEELFTSIVSKACRDASLPQCAQSFSNAQSQLKDIDCHALLVQTVFDECPRRTIHNSPGGWNGFNMKFARVLVNMCEGQQVLGKTPAQLNRLVKAECGASRAKDSQIVV